MMDQDAKATIALSFTGWESDRFVYCAQELTAMGIIPQVRVVGREPITTTPVDFSGKVVDVLWEGYRRFIVVQTNDGITYQVGGSNATRPIASEKVVFVDLPQSFIGPLYTDNDLDTLLDELNKQSEQRTVIARQLKFGIRLGRFTPESKMKIVHRISPYLGIDDVDFKCEIAELLGSIEIPEVLEPLLTLLQDSDPAVRIAAALRFRGMELIIKDVGEESEVGSRCINGLISALNDPIDKVRIYAVEDLGYFYNTHAIAHLVHALEQDPNDDVRWAAAIALGRTNDPGVAQYLLSALSEDPSLVVQRAALLGLGRRGEAALSRQPGLVKKLIPILCRLLLEGDQVVRDYAAYTTGTLGPHAVNCLPSLCSNLRPDSPVEIKSNVALSLSKLVDQLYKYPELTNDVERYLWENLSLPRETGYPTSAYYSWYLEYGAELATHLELSELASQYYAHASLAFSSILWRSKYYAGISKYEYVEYYVSHGRLSEALATLEEALSLFHEVHMLDTFQVQSEKVRVGIEFRMTMAQGRRHMLQATSQWWHALTEEDHTRVAEEFNEAHKQYNLVDIADMGNTGKRLTPAEQNLVTSFRTLTVLGNAVIRLWFSNASYAREEKMVVFARVVDLVQLLYSYTLRTRSKAMRETSQKLRDVTGQTNDRIKRLPAEDISGELYNFIFLVKEIYYTTSLAMPGIECPIISFGHATLSMRIPGSLSGDGSQQNPFIFPSSIRLIFEPIVYVQKRTKNDRLVFRDSTPPPGTNFTTEEVPVHESTYNVLPIDYGMQAPTAAAIHFRFSLDFQNSGCSQPADPDHKTYIYYVKIYDPEQDTSSDRQKKLTDLQALQIQLTQLHGQLKQLQATKHSGHVDDFGVQRDIRRVQNKLKDVENRIKKFGR